MLFSVSRKYSGVLKNGPEGIPLAFFLKLAERPYPVQAGLVGFFSPISSQSIMVCMWS
jgi:hypothetical protein